MGKELNKALNDHAQRYVREVMANQLLSNGYVSKGNQDLHWYRIVNSDMVQAVYFYTQWAAGPIMMAIGYASHPLFIAPEYPKNLYMPTMLRSLEAVNPGRMILKQKNLGCYAPDIAVSCPNDEYKGSDIIEDILARLDKISTIEECYNMHKQEYIKVAELVNLPAEEVFWNMSADFMNEVVYMDDSELYSRCVIRITKELARYEKAQQVRKLWNVEKADLESLNRLKSAIIDGKRQEHLDYLENQRQANLRQLIKKVGCSIN